MTAQGMISADSHVIEPRNLWVERVDKAFRDRAPRVVRDANGLKGEWFICPGLEPRPASLAFAAGKDPSEGAWRRGARARAQVPRSAARRVPVSGWLA